jgi:hypothetical protein
LYLLALPLRGRLWNEVVFHLRSHFEECSSGVVNVSCEFIFWRTLWTLYEYQQQCLPCGWKIHSWMKLTTNTPTILYRWIECECTNSISFDWNFSIYKLIVHCMNKVMFMNKVYYTYIWPLWKLDEIWNCVHESNQAKWMK